MERETYGYHDRILRVNLSTGAVTTESPGEGFYRRYFGGRNLIAYYLLREVPVGCDPLGPENLLIFAAGPLTGAPISGTGRNSVGAKSPLTNGYGDGEAGGFWGAELKRAGLDAIVIEGASETPVYLWIKDGEAEIRPAGHLWGRKTADVEAQIRLDLEDPGVRVAQIGVAGERLVRFAGIANDVTHYYGRSGMGAVMGSKKLRAVAVRGTQPVPMADPAGVKALFRWLADNRDRIAGMQDTGTSGGVPYLNEVGGLPTRNFLSGQFEGYENLSGATMRDTILAGRGTCWACMVRCKREVEITEPPYVCHPEYGGPEYETMASLGSLCGVDNLAAVSHGNELCNAYGVDTISAGMAIAFAMECFESGLIDESDTDGLELRFGNAEAMVAMLNAIALRTGFGKLLGEGTSVAAREIGQGAQRYALNVKDQPLPMHEPRFKKGLGVGYAVSPTGADHVHNIHDDGYAALNRGFREQLFPHGILDPLPVADLGPGKMRMLYYLSTYQHLYNALELCIFMPYSPNQIVGLVQAVTGWNTTLWELLKVAERGVQLSRLFNIREGRTAADDTLPDRFFDEPFKDGPLAGVAVDREEFGKALQLYYGMMGWDNEGRPSPVRLHELDLGWAVEHLPDS